MNSLLFFYYFVFVYTWFERLTILVIIGNCVTLGAVDPCEGDECLTLRCSSLQIADHFISAYFTVEMLIKMLAMGIYGKHSYLDENWNRLDCFIVIAGLAEYIFVWESFNFSAIRTIRVLRPLRAINRIPSLRLLVMLLLDTLPMLGNVLLICFFVFFVFGIAGVQLWSGVLRQRCFFPPITNTFELNKFSDNSQPILTKEKRDISSQMPLVNDQITTYYPSFMPHYYNPPKRDFVCSPPGDSGILRCDVIPKYE